MFKVIQCRLGTSGKVWWNWLGYEIVLCETTILRMLRLIEPTAGVLLYQLKIILNDSKPPIWRRIVVPANLKLNRLHNVFQRVMPWTDSHLHPFLVGKEYYGVPDPDYADEGPKMLNEKNYTIADIAPGPKSVFIYEYDFGDGWEHIVVVENVLPPDPAFKRVVCLAGENACPPEDCGGIHGYYRMLKILAYPKNEEYESMREWVGGEWDAKRFDLAQANAALKRIKAWQCGGYAGKQMSLFLAQQRALIPAPFPS